VCVMGKSIVPLLISFFLLFPLQIGAMADSIEVNYLCSKQGKVHDGWNWRVGKKKIRIILKENQRKVFIGQTFIVPGSDSLNLNSDLLKRGIDYTINTLKGTVILKRNIRDGDVLEVYFSRFPLSFSPMFVRHLPKDTLGIDVSPGDRYVKVSGNEKGVRPNYTLNLSGSKSIGISVGTGKGLGLDQSLQLSMSGKIAKDIKVTAYLTDDNLPVQPEGNTEEIRQLDKVFVKVEGKSSEVMLGDITSGVSWSRFSSFRRDLRGISAMLNIGDNGLFATAGISKGRFRSVKIIGREGVQGPYELLPLRRFNGVIILPASESVYLDGRLLRRGDENDYTIDYALGTITFTEKVVITDDSEIVVDFQISEDDFTRTTIFAGWVSGDIGNMLKLRTYILEDSDDKERPIRGGFEEGDRDILRSAGDDVTKAVASGVREVGAGEGDYIYIPGDSISSHFEYVEEGGNYILSFIQVGQGRGDYTTDGFTSKGDVKYRYVGAGNGDFIIGRKLPVPKRNRLVSIGATVEKGVFQVDMEGDVSSYDRNTFSSLDDKDNLGRAFYMSGGLNDFKVGGVQISMLGKFSYLEDRFKSPDRERKQYFYRNWNLDDIPLVGVERIGGGSLSIKRADVFKVSAGWEELSRSSGFDATKKELLFDIGDLTQRGLKFEAYSSSSSKQRSRNAVRVEGVLSFWKLKPAYIFDRERYSSFYPEFPDTGRYYTEHTISIQTVNTGNGSGRILYRRRDTELLNSLLDSWYMARRSDEIAFDGSYSGSSAMVDLFVAHRVTRDFSMEHTSWYDLAKVRYRDRWRALGITSDLHYRITSGEERTREKAVVYVGENQGDYDSEGREVGQKRGDYMLLYLPSAYSERAHSVMLDWKLSFGRGIRRTSKATSREGLRGKLSRFVSLDNFLYVEERSRTDDLVGLYLLKPSVLQRNDLTIYGITKLRQEWHFFPYARKVDITLTFSREDEEDNRAEGNPIDRYLRQTRLRLLWAAGRFLSLQWEGGESKKQRSAKLASEQVYDVRSYSFSQKVVYRISGATRLALECGLETREDHETSAEQVSYMITPSVNSSIGKKTNISAFFRLTFTSSEENITKPLFFLERGLREDWNFTFHYRLTKNLSIAANYFGRRERDYTGEVKTVNDLKVESRAHF